MITSDTEHYTPTPGPLVTANDAHNDIDGDLSDSDDNTSIWKNLCIDKMLTRLNVSQEEKHRFRQRRTIEVEAATFCYDEVRGVHCATTIRSLDLNLPDTFVKIDFSYYHRERAWWIDHEFSIKFDINGSKGKIATSHMMPYDNHREEADPESKYESSNSNAMISTAFDAKCLETSWGIGLRI
ncbi:hypothetical protein HK102_001222 [Quaeritorhiza haematococci]|nr:hypothetical protein HK102_001222 [Quaeritorhiza haematococci]